MDKMNGMMEEEEGVDLVKNVEEANPYPSADNGKEFAYSAKGMKAAKMEAKKTGKKMVVKPSMKKMGKKK